MGYKNISAKLYGSSLQRIRSSIDQIHQELPFLITLSEEEKRKLSKIDETTIDFVVKALESSEARPELVPPYIEVAELRKDLVLANDLANILTQIRKLERAINDTAVAVGNKAYQSSLAYYNSVRRQASRADATNAVIIASELQSKLEGRETTENKSIEAAA